MFIPVIMSVLSAFPSFASPANGKLQVLGKPGDGQPVSVFLEKCRVSDKGILQKFSCGDGPVFETLFSANLNEVTELPAGHYSLSYDLVGSNMLIDVAEGRTTEVRLEQVMFPANVKPRDIRVISDLNDTQARERFLLSAFSINSFEQYLYERNKGNVPNTPENQNFYSGMENAQKPADLLNLLVRLDANGYPSYWNVYHCAFVAGNGVHAPAIWAGETGHFVSVLPGNVFALLIYADGSTEPTQIIRGVHSR